MSENESDRFNELMISLQEWAEHFTEQVHPVALTLNRALSEFTKVKKQRDGLRDALGKMLSTFNMGCASEYEVWSESHDLWWAIKKADDISETDHSKVERLLGMKIVIDDTLPSGTAIVKGGEA